MLRQFCCVFIFQNLLLVHYLEGNSQPPTPLATLYLSNSAWANQNWGNTTGGGGGGGGAMHDHCSHDVES